MTREYQITVNTPQDKAFLLVTNDPRLDEWMEGQLVTDYPGNDNKSKEGLKFHQSYWPFWELDGKITEYKPPALLAVEFQVNIMSITGTIFYYFQAIDADKTEIKCKLELSDNDVGRKTVIKLMMPVVDRVLNSHLKSVRDIAEKK